VRCMRHACQPTMHRRDAQPMSTTARTKVRHVQPEWGDMRPTVAPDCAYNIGAHSARNLPLMVWGVVLETAGSKAVRSVVH
jgi:hypothetical protein